MENPFLKFIIITAVVALGGFLIWFVAIPYIKNLRGETLNKRIALELVEDVRKPVPVTFGTSTLIVELALSQDERALGLGKRFFLDEDEGMLFVYEKAGYPAIWMKDMLFPIDIIWLSSSFSVVHVERNVSPSSYPTSFKPKIPAQYVLETSAGYVDAHGVNLGDTLRLIDREKISL